MLEEPMILTPSLYSLEEIERPGSFSWRNHLFAVSVRYLARGTRVPYPAKYIRPPELRMTGSSWGSRASPCALTCRLGARVTD